MSLDDSLIAGNRLLQTIRQRSISAGTQRCFNKISDKSLPRFCLALICFWHKCFITPKYLILQVIQNGFIHFLLDKRDIQRYCRNTVFSKNICPLSFLCRNAIQIFYPKRTSARNRVTL